MAGIKRVLSFAYKHSNLLFILMGLCCIIFNEKINSVFVYVFSGCMILVGCIGIILGILSLVKHHFKSYVLAYSLILIVLGIVYLFKHTDSLLFISWTWGFLGIIRGGAQFSAGIRQISEKSLWCIVTFLQAAFTISVSLLLFFHGVDAIKTHIILLGVELIVVALATFGGHKEEISLWHMFEFETQTCEREDG